MPDKSWPDGLILQIEGAANFQEALEKAIQYYREKFGRQPSAVYADPNLEGFFEMPGVLALPNPKPNMFILTHE
jgi:hypothetical protein